jgi:YggT family protein
VAFFALFLQSLVLVLWLLVLGRVLVSWVDPTGRNTISQYLVGMTEPLLGPIRRVLPQTGMVDWSPLVLMIGLGILLRVVSAL